MKEEKIWAIKDGYLVNRDGSIYKLNWHRTKTMRKIKTRLNKDGYCIFYKNDRDYLVHRFIAECFIPNPYNLSQINHKDEDKTNNHVDNLEWCDHRYNCNYGTRNKRIGKSNINNPKFSKKVLQYTLNGELVKEWCSLMEIERELGFKQPYITHCCKGRCKSAYDYIWSYKPLS